MVRGVVLKPARVLAGYSGDPVQTSTFQSGGRGLLIWQDAKVDFIQVRLCRLSVVGVPRNLEMVERHPLLEAEGACANEVAAGDRAIQRFRVGDER